MNRLRYWIRDVFGFPKAHVNGFIILLFLVSLGLFSEPAWHWWTSRRKPNYIAEQKLLDSLVQTWQDAKIADKPQADSTPVLFNFDPNTAAKTSLLALGFTEALSTRIVRYREKGGKFRIKKDLLKIYGVDSSFYRGLHAFISLPDDHNPEIKKRATKFTSTPASEKKKVFQIFDINAADTAQLKKIYGIGEKLSMRIIKYRDALGGFVTLDQLREVYGLDSIVIKQLLKQAMVNPNDQPTKINLNTATEKQLTAHPYFSKVASAIVSYRFQHGNFKSVDEIRNIGSLDVKTIEKITPYSKVSDEL